MPSIAGRRLQRNLPRGLDFALSLRVIWCSSRVFHAFVFQRLSQFPRDVTGTVVTEQSWLVNDVGLVSTRRLQRQVQRVRHVFSPHIGAQFPSDDVAAVIVQDRAEIEPAPADDLEVGEVSLPKLIDRRGFVFELAGRLDRCE